MGLLDLLLAVIIASLLAAVAIPAYDQFVERAKVTRAIGDISSISIELQRFCLRSNDQLPNSLNELPIEIPLDPWGQPYQYLNIMAAGPGNGDFRKDGKLNPLNSDFDLYSAGADGESKGPLSAKASRDDIVRANNGAFIGLGEDY
jgi:general secretion pathway protein G